MYCDIMCVCLVGVCMWLGLIYVLILCVVECIVGCYCCVMCVCVCRGYVLCV